MLPFSGVNGASNSMQKGRSETEGVGTPFKDARDGILVIDDEPVLRTTFKHMLEEEGYRVWVAQNGREGLELFRKNRPEIVITDMVMPVLDGFAMIDSLRRECPGLPIIAMSAFLEPEKMEKSLDSGAFCYLTKPVEMPVLFDLIRAILVPQPGLDDDGREIEPL